MKRKILSVILITVMLFSLFSMSACGDSKTPSGGETTPAADDTTAPVGDDTKDTDAETTKEKETEPAETEPEGYQPNPDNQYTGAVGLGTWATSVYYDDIKVTDNKSRKVLYENKFDDAATISDFTFFKGIDGTWDPANSSEWKVSDFNGNNVLEFTNPDPTGVCASVGNSEWGNYTVTVKGRVTGGAEGLMVFFGVQDENNYYFLNVGGWNNTCICVQQVKDGVKTVVTDQIPLTLKQNSWYNISINVGQTSINGFIDGEKFFQIGGTLPGESDGNKGMAGMSTWSTEVFYDNVKVTDFKTGDVLYENTFDNPADLDGFKYDFTYSSGSSPKNASLWEIADGKLHQTSASTTGVALGFGSAEWRNYIYEVEAMPVAGAEGFTVIGAIADSENFSVYNIGGWSNTKACFQIVDAATETNQDQIDLSVEYEEWHKAKLVVLDYAIFAYVDGEFCQAFWK